jgi:hypothetical protein
MYHGMRQNRMRTQCFCTTVHLYDRRKGMHEKAFDCEGEPETQLYIHSVSETNASISIVQYREVR